MDDLKSLLIEFLNGEDRHGWFRHAVVGQGWLLESRKSVRRKPCESPDRTGNGQRHSAVSE